MSSAAKVGVFMLVILGILGYFILRIEDIHPSREGTRTVHAVFNSVAGLDNKSAVRIAGVRMGQVTDIKLLPDGKAEVTMEIDRDVQLHRNATAAVANLGLLGEKYVELNPGTANEPLVPPEQALVLPGSQPASIDQVTDQISAIATDVKAITASLRASMAGPEGQKRLQDIVGNVDQITAQIRELVAANRENVDATLGNVRAVTAELRTSIPHLADSIEKVADALSGTVNENRANLQGVVENLRSLSGELRTTADNLNAITGQVRSGQGTVGKLIYSDEAHDKLTAALSSVESGVNELKETLGRANRISLDIGMKGEYYAGLKNVQPDNATNIGSTSRAAVQVKIIPNPEQNRFYNIEVASDPQGKRHYSTVEDTFLIPSTGQTITVVRNQTSYDRGYLVSAQAGWSLKPFDVRIGLIDSTGGGGVDYYPTDRIRLTGEMFDFGKQYDNKPHLRLFGEYTLRREKKNTPLIFLSTGVDNLFNQRAFTFGGGIRWRDDDLKYLLSSAPIPK